MTQSLYWCCADLLMLAVRLPHAANLPPAPELRQSIRTMLDEMVGRGRAAQVPDAELAEARYALVAFLDEQVQKSNWPGRVDWSPLQLEEYGENTAGENFYKRTRTLLQQGGASPALEVYYLCLLLGFRGAYGDGDRRALASVQDGARQRVALAWRVGPKLAPRAEPPERFPARRGKRWPLIAVVIGSFVLAILVVTGLERLVSSSVEKSLDAVGVKPIEAGG